MESTIPEPLIPQKGDDSLDNSTTKPNFMMSSIGNVLQKRVLDQQKQTGFIVYGDNPKFGTSSASSVPEMLQSEAFGSAVRPKPALRYT